MNLLVTSNISFWSSGYFPRRPHSSLWLGKPPKRRCLLPLTTMAIGLPNFSTGPPIHWLGQKTIKPESNRSLATIQPCPHSTTQIYQILAIQISHVHCNNYFYNTFDIMKTPSSPCPNSSSHMIINYSVSGVLARDRREQALSVPQAPPVDRSAPPRRVSAKASALNWAMQR